MPKNLKGGGKSKKISEIIGELFSRKQDKIDYMPNSNIFVRNLTHKYINMITLSELRNIIDSNPNLKSSKTIMDIYNNKKLIDKKDIYENIELTFINNSLIDNVKLLFQYIMEYDDDRFVRKDIDIYSVITCNEIYDPFYENQIEMILSDKLFDIDDIKDIIDKTKVELLSDSIFKELVNSKLEKCSEKPYGLLDFFTNDISFSSNKKCNLPNNALLKLNKQNLIFLSETINSLSYNDKIKLLILFEHRLTLLSKYFSLEV